MKAKTKRILSESMKKKMLIGAGIVLGGIGLMAIESLCRSLIVKDLGCLLDRETENGTVGNLTSLPIPDGAVGRIVEFFRDDDAGETIAIVTGLTVGDLGRIDERLCLADGITSLSEAAVTIETR